MGDRRPFSFRFWQSGAPTTRRPPPAQTTTPRPAPKTTAAPPATTTSASTPLPRTAETQTSGGQFTATAITPASIAPAPSPASTPTATLTSTQPKTETQIAGRPTTTSTRPTNGHQTKSPSRAATPSPSSSPSRFNAQSRSPPQPSSPSRAAPQARSKPSSPSHMGSQSPSTPQRASQVRSSSRLTPSSPKRTSSHPTKGIQSTSPPKESTQDISHSNKAPTFASSDEEPKSETTQKEPLAPQLKADQSVDEKNIRENQMKKVNSPKLSEISKTASPVQDPKTPTPVKNFVSSAINAEDNPHNDKKPEETKEVKEVEQATITETITEANEQIEKESKPPLTPNSDTEAQTTKAVEIPSKRDQIQMEKKDALNTKEILPASLLDMKQANTTTSQPRKSSMSSDTCVQSAGPSGGHVPLFKDIKDDISTFIKRTTIGDPKSTYDRPISVITLSGENKGASMQMGSNDSKRQGSVHIHRGYKIKHDGRAEVTSDVVESSNKNKSEDAKFPEDQQKELHLNNNIQCINNSIVFNSSIAERDPGVHVVTTRVPNKSTESTDRRPPETRKAEFSTTPADKLTYEPSVRRRCIRDLYLEPSDSDPESPKMP